MTDDPKLKEFRDNNIKLTQQVEDLTKERDGLVVKFKDIDPEVVKVKLAELETVNAKLAELDTIKAQLVARDTELATEKAARVDAQQKADRGRLRDTLRTKALAIGALPAGVDMLIDKAEPFFTMEGEAIKARPNTFSPTQPGIPLTPDEWLANATRGLAFLFAPSVGGGARHGSGAGGTGGSNVPVLTDPTPQQLGERAAEIKAGKLRVEYSNGG